jgi:aspartate aminotransferase-like enzyme
VKGVKAAGLSIFPQERPSDALTADFGAGRRGRPSDLQEFRVTQYGMTAAGGQDHLKGKIFRISHMGYIDSFDVITALAAVEMVIKGLGYPIKLGSGVAKAQEIIMGKS